MSNDPQYLLVSVVVLICVILLKPHLNESFPSRGHMQPSYAPPPRYPPPGYPAPPSYGYHNEYGVTPYRPSQTIMGVSSQNSWLLPMYGVYGYSGYIENPQCFSGMSDIRGVCI